MKKFTNLTLTLIFTLFLGIALNAQVIYGLQKSIPGSQTIPFDIVSLDPFSGNTTNLFSTGSLVAVAAGATTYDQQNQRYIC